MALKITKSTNSMATSISNIDLCTLRSEILPMNSKFTFDEIENWMQWAISSSKGLGFGAFGHSGKWDDEVSYDFMRDIRSRLPQVETNNVEVCTSLALLNSSLSMQVIF